MVYAALSSATRTVSRELSARTVNSRGKPVVVKPRPPLTAFGAPPRADRVRVTTEGRADSVTARVRGRRSLAGCHAGAVRIADVGEIAIALDGVKESRVKGLRQWTLGGRLVARQYDKDSIVVRTRIAERDRLLQRYPDMCFVPPRFDAQTKVVLRLPMAEPELVESALRAAWLLQRITD